MKFYENKEYIKMCEKAIDDISYCCPMIALGKNPEVYFYNDFTYWWNGERLIPLWRQDQLQEMIYEITRDKFEIIRLSSLWYIIGEAFHRETLVSESLERVLLQFLMKEKFNKTWNGTDWVTKDTTKK